MTTLSYSTLAEHQRCGYRFYAERVLGLPPVGPAAEASPVAGAREGLAPAPERGGSARSGSDRGLLLHGLLERLSFRAPLPPAPDAVRAAAHAAGLHPPGETESEALVATVQRFLASPLRARLAQAPEPRREERFAFALAGVLVTGIIDVLAREPGGQTLIVDYKSDRLAGTDPTRLVSTLYGTQRLIYALAALHAGAGRVEVAYCFLDDPDHPVSATYERSDREPLGDELLRRAGGVLRREFPVAEAPHRGLCSGCPAEGGLCTWPRDVTRREAPDRLF